MKSGDKGLEMNDQSERKQTLRQLAAFCLMFFGLSGLIIWAVLHQRAGVETAFKQHLKFFHLDSLILPYDVKVKRNFLGPDSYSAKARLAEGAALTDVRAALLKTQGCSPKLDEGSLECSVGRDFYWGVRVTASHDKEIDVLITPPISDDLASASG